MDSEIDYELTKSVYRDQLESFMDCFIMTCSPFEEDMESLKREAMIRRSVRGYSWIENAMGFCYYRSIDNVKPVQLPNYNPYLEIHLTPSTDIITSNWFYWDCRPCFAVMADGAECLNHDYGSPTRTTFIDIQGVDNQISFLKDNIGGYIIECFRFSSVNSFNKERWCYRFAKEDSLREAVLLTQGFVLNYIERHPLDCFAGPYIKNKPSYSALANIVKSDILSPILEEYLPQLRTRKSWIETELMRHNLVAERI